MKFSIGHLYRNQDAFTLMEILIAIAVVAMLAIGMAAGLSAAIKAWESGEKNLEMYQTKRIVTDRLRTEISNAVNIRGQQEDSDKYEMIFSGDKDSLSFLTTSHALSSPDMPMALKESSIYVEPGVGLVIREAMFSTTEFFNKAAGFVYVLDPTVSDIEFAYYYVPRRSRSLVSEDDIEGEWLSQWGPEHIEIIESFSEEEGGGDEASRMQQREVTMQLPLAVEVLVTSVNELTGQKTDWQPIIIPLKEARVLGLSITRRY